MRKPLVGLLYVCVAASSAHSQTNLVSNPGFESPGFSITPDDYRYLNGSNATFLTGWTFTYDGVHEASYVFHEHRYPVFAGDYCVQLGDGDSCQTSVSTEEDCKYVLIITTIGGDGGTVRFRAGDLDTTFIPTISSSQAVGTGKKRMSQSNEEQEWFKLYLPFTSTGSSTTVRIDDTGQSLLYNGRLLDDIAVVAGPAIMIPPATAAACNNGEIEFRTKAAGVGPLTYEWQIETSTGVWATLSTSPVSLSCGGSASATNADTDTAQITIGGCYEVNTYNVRCIVSNSCGSVATQAVFELCWADFNCDGLVDDTDFAAFTAAYNVLDCDDPQMPAGCPSDLNGDGLVTDEDFVIFSAAYERLQCHEEPEE